MALFFGTDPQVSQSQLQIGQPLTVTIPNRSILRVIDATGPVVTLGSYNGVSQNPSDDFRPGWNTDNSIWSAQR